MQEGINAGTKEGRRVDARSAYIGGVKPIWNAQLRLILPSISACKFNTYVDRFTHLCDFKETNLSQYLG